MSTKTYNMRRFDSIGDFVAASVAGRKTDGASSRSGDHYGNNWSGSESFEECVGHALYGTWRADEYRHFTNLFENLEPNLRTYVEIGYEQGIAQGGYEVNMQAYLDGEPEHMNEWLPAEHQVTKHAICMIIGHSISSSVSSEDLFAKGQAIIALVRALNLLGFELELYSEQTVSGSRDAGPQHYSVLTKLVGAGDIMDESAIEFAVGNPSWLRRLIFGLEEGESDQVRRKFGFGMGGFGGYGTPSGIHHGELVSADLEIELGRSWFDRYNHEDAMTWVVDQLKAVGAIAEDAEIEFS